jgi:hypothetical protein
MRRIGVDREASCQPAGHRASEHGERPSDADARPYQSKSGSIDFVEEIPTRPHRATASTVLAA